MARREDNPAMNVSNEPVNAPGQTAGVATESANASSLPSNAAGQAEKAVAPAAEAAKIKLKHLGRVLHEPARWRILRELARGEALPVKELAARVRCPAASVSKHMARLRMAGMVKISYGGLYKLSALAQVSPDGRRLDVGHCVLKLDGEW